MTGGWMPTGISERIAFEAETIWLIARSTLTFGWKKTFSTATPDSVWLSILRISLTLELMEYSIHNPEGKGMTGKKSC
jgi:hypothetical protein